MANFSQEVINKLTEARQAAASSTEGDSSIGDVLSEIKNVLSEIIKDGKSKDKDKVKASKKFDEILKFLINSEEKSEEKEKKREEREKRREEATRGKKGFEAWASKISSDLKDVGKSISDFGDKKFAKELSLVKDTFKTAYSSIKTSVSNGFKNVGATLKNTFASIKSFVATEFNKHFGLITKGFLLIKGFILGTFMMIKMAILLPIMLAFKGIIIAFKVIMFPIMFFIKSIQLAMIAWQVALVTTKIVILAAIKGIAALVSFIAFMVSPIGILITLGVILAAILSPKFQGFLVAIGKAIWATITFPFTAMSWLWTGLKTTWVKLFGDGEGKTGWLTKAWVTVFGEGEKPGWLTPVYEAVLGEDGFITHLIGAKEGETFWDVFKRVFPNAGNYLQELWDGLNPFITWFKTDGINILELLGAFLSGFSDSEDGGIKGAIREMADVRVKHAMDRGDTLEATKARMTQMNMDHQMGSLGAAVSSVYGYSATEASRQIHEARGRDRESQLALHTRFEEIAPNVLYNSLMRAFAMLNFTKGKDIDNNISITKDSLISFSNLLKGPNNEDPFYAHQFKMNLRDWDKDSNFLRRYIKRFKDQGGISYEDFDHVFKGKQYEGMLGPEIFNIFETSLRPLKKEFNQFPEQLNSVFNPITDFITNELYVPMQDNLQHSEKLNKVEPLATGGIAIKPLYAHIAEAGDHEAVIPLNDRGIEFMKNTMMSAIKSLNIESPEVTFNALGNKVESKLDDLIGHVSSLTANILKETSTNEEYPQVRDADTTEFARMIGSGTIGCRNGGI